MRVGLFGVTHQSKSTFCKKEGNKKKTNRIYFISEVCSFVLKLFKSILTLTSASVFIIKNRFIQTGFNLNLGLKSI